jgi:hypothetical protein
MALIGAALLSSTAWAQTPPDSVGATAIQQPAVPDSVPSQPPAATPAPAATAAPAPAATAAPAPAATTPPPASPPPTTQAAQPAQAQAASSAPRRGDPFARGNLRLSGTAGWGQGFGTDYLIIGVGAGYYIRNGLDVGLYYENWAFGDPGVSKLSPEVRLTRQLPMGVAPYVGAYYRRTFIDGFDDLDSFGGRAGAYKYSPRGRSMFGGGVVYEKYLDCDESAYTDCSNVYPEILFATSF